MVMSKKLIKMLNIFENSIFYLLQDLYIYILIYVYVFIYICILYIIFCCPGFIVILGPYGTIFGRGRADFFRKSAGVGHQFRGGHAKEANVAYPSCMVTTRGLDSNWH